MADTTDLFRRTFRELGVVSTGVPVSGEETASATLAYDALYPELQRLRIASWAKDTIPDDRVHHVAVMLANRLSREYGIPEDRRGALFFQAESDANPQSAKAMLIKLAEADDDGFTETLELKYY